MSGTDLEMGTEEIAADPVAMALGAFFQQLNKAIKNMRLYVHQPERFPEFLGPAFGIFNEQLEEFHQLTLKVEQEGFRYRKTLVYEEEVSDQNLAFAFYNEGIRLLKFQRGLMLPEMLAFVQICASASQSVRMMNEDLLGQLWAKNFQNIEYVIMESYAVAGKEDEGPTADDLELEVDQIVGHLYQSLTGKGDDNIQFARISMEDLEIDLDNIRQARGIRLGESTISNQLVARFQDEIIAEDEQRLLPKLLRVLLMVFSQSLDRALTADIGNALILMLDFFLLKEDFDNIQMMMGTVKKLEARTDESTAAGWREIYYRLQQKMSDRERIHRVAEIVETTGKLDNIRKSRVYLKYLDGSQCFEPLLSALETINRPEARQLFCMYLANIGHDHLELLQQKLQSPKANLVRDVMSIIDHIDPPGRVGLVADLLQHRNLSIRLEALKIIGAGEEQHSYPYLSRAVRDPDAQVRTVAAQLIATAAPKRSVPLLLESVQDVDFRGATVQEQTGFYTALASTNDPQALGYLQKLLQASKLFAKKKPDEHKRIIVKALAQAGTIRSYKLLNEELSRGVKNEELAAAMERAQQQLKKRLFGN